MKALLDISIQEWLDPLDKTDEAYGHYRDSVLFGLFLNAKQGPRKRLTGFGYGLSHYGRAYISSIEYFYTNLRKKFPFMLPRMPNARLQADLSFLRMYDFLNSSSVDGGDVELIAKYEKILDCEEFIDLQSMVTNDGVYKEIEGLLIAAGLFSRTAFRSNTKWFDKMIDPILNFDDEERGELSYYPDWGQGASEAWCIAFDMNEFRVYFETSMYIQFRRIKNSREASEYLCRECDAIMNCLTFADIGAKTVRPISVEVQRPYIYSPLDLSSAKNS